MTTKREHELDDEQLDNVAGGIMPTALEYPNLKSTSSSVGTERGFMDYTDDSCMG